MELIKCVKLEMAQCLRVLAACAEDMVQFPELKTHMWSRTVRHFSFRGSNPPFQDSKGTRDACSKYTHIHTHKKTLAYMILNLKSNKIQWVKISLNKSKRLYRENRER